MLHSVLRERWSSLIETNEVALQMIAGGQLRPKAGGTGVQEAALIREVNENLKRLLELYSV